MSSVQSELILYGDEASAPVRFVMITAKLLGMDIHLHRIDLFKGEHKSDFYKKINPLQKVPALAVDGEIICDSHAIALYLCGMSEHQGLYPADNMLRAKVDQLLYFNASTLFPVNSFILSEYFAGNWLADKIMIDEWHSAIDHLEMHLNKNKWLTGEKMQLCDVCCAMTVSSLSVLFPPLDRHVRVNEWMKNIGDLPCSDINNKGVARLKYFLKERYNLADSE